MSLFDSIMDGEKPNDDNTLPADSSNPGEPDQSPEPSWWWDANTPGEGERPDWLPDKYRSAEDTARAFKELEKRLGTAPEQYDWSKGESWVDLDYQPFHDLAAFAKSKHITQDVMDKMLETVGMYLDEFNVDYNEEKKALGDNAEERLRVLNNWAKSNFSEQAYNALTANMRTAESVKAIEEIRERMMQNNTTIPTGNETTPTAPSISEVQIELNQNLQKYKEDPKYRQEIQRKFALASELAQKG